jgi:regulator of protease activity HflC (stomatin/prohibitin superfamily)
MLVEKENPGINGWIILLVVAPILLFCGYSIVSGLSHFNPEALPSVLGSSLFELIIIVGGLFCLQGFFVVNPGEAKVLQFFGSYVGTAKQSGLRWVIPFYTRRTMSLRIRNFESTKLKVNDKDGSPIEIAAIVAWRVRNTVEALFQVDRYEEYVHVQTESAVRNLAMSYTYDSHEAGQISLHGSPEKVTEHLKKEIEERLSKAGVEVIEARLSHLAYAPEIAASMLQRQQAGAIIAARQKIVEGAVGMVEMALEKLAASNLVSLDEEKRASMVSNLLVVLCSERSTQPIVNAGTLYQ